MNPSNPLTPEQGDALCDVTLLTKVCDFETNKQRSSKSDKMSVGRSSGCLCGLLMGSKVLNTSEPQQLLKCRSGAPWWFLPSTALDGRNRGAHLGSGTPSSKPTKGLFLWPRDAGWHAMKHITLVLGIGSEVYGLGSLPN